MELVKNIADSLKNNPKGFSGKKLTALAVTLTYIYVHKFTTSDILTSVLAVDAGLIAAMFGINVVDKFKNKDEHDAINE